MTPSVVYFAPQPRAGDLPARLPSPFVPGPPHPLARRAAEELQAQLGRGEPLPPAEFQGTQKGKMMGVLVVSDDAGRLGYLRGFSGMLGGRWQLEGFVGPLFDAVQRATFWPDGEAELSAYDVQVTELAGGAEITRLRAALATLDAVQAEEAAELDAAQAARRQQRHRQRQHLAEAGLPPDGLQAALHALDQESRADKASGRRQRGGHREAREALLVALQAIEDRRLALQRHRAGRSRELLERLWEGYQIVGARGARRGLRELFPTGGPPGGAGDCAAPKLFGHALVAGLRPVALAEFWWGTPPVTGGRYPGSYYPSCRGKCGPVLQHMLDGLEVEPAPGFGSSGVPLDEPRTVYEDAWLLVVDKPVGLLSVPGRGEHLSDSVLTRLRARLPAASGPLLAHRLDLDTSGLLLAAKDPETHAALQQQFQRRTIEKRYIAWIDGHVAGDAGVIDLPIRVDLDDRPRQIHDPVHGRDAVTGWRVLQRQGDRTRVAFEPRTGRTHQLRVHASHPLGLGAPIAGDRLYGKSPVLPGERLMLHAEALGLVHPRTRERLDLTLPAPF